MMTTTFEPQQAGEGWSEYGRRAMLHCLQLPADDYSQLSNDALQAGGDACNHAMACRDVSDVTLACLAALQTTLRRRLASRRADTLRRLAGLHSEPAPAAEMPAGNDAPAASGGSKVPRPAGPKPKPAPAAFGVPALQLTADSF